MVAAQWGESRESDTRTGGVAGRFRLLGDSADGATSESAPDHRPPEFGTAPWGYRRSEVDAWASWVAGLIAHGRNETVRADSAEATLRATLERLEQVERLQPPDVDTAGPTATGPEATGQEADPSRTRASARLHFDAPADLPRRTARDTEAATGVPVDQAIDENRTTTGATTPADSEADHTPPPAPGQTQDHGLARLHVVETTLHEVMGLLRHLAGPERGR